MTRHLYWPGACLFVAWLALTSMSMAAPRDVRLVLEKSGIFPDTVVPGPILATAEPGFQPPPLYLSLEKPPFLAQFAPLDTDTITLSEQQAAEFYAILTDRRTYSPAFGGKV